MGPFIRSKEKTNKMMLNVLIALVPIILFTIYKNGYIPYRNGYISFLQMFYPLVLLLIGAITSFAIETIYLLIRKRKEAIFDSYSFFPGLFLALLLPTNAPIYVVALGASIATIIGKLVFGGFGKNLVNPALIGYLFVIFVLGSSIGSYQNAYEIDTISKATPLTNASMTVGIGNYNELVKPYGDLGDFFLGFISGGMAEISKLCILIGFIYLVVTKTIKWRIPVFYVGTVFLTTFIIGRLLGQGFYYPFFHILSGGLLFGAVFMATDPVTSAVTPIGQTLQGILLGILTVVFRFIGVEGVAFSILIVNLVVFLLDKVGSSSRFHIAKTIIPFTISALLIMATGITFAALNHVKGSEDPNFKMISQEKKGSQTVYVVTQKGYGGNIKGQITFENDKITDITILSHNETEDRYQLVIGADYINRILANQSDLDSLDTVSSATVTSTAMKRMIINTINYR